MDSLLRHIRALIPTRLFKALQPAYHYSLALAGALIYRFPSRQIKVVAITGTKGKSSTTEIINAMLDGAGKNTAMAGTIRFKIADKIWPNKFKMTMPGRFFLQKFLRQAVNAGCDYAVIEMSSEGAKFFRHKFIDLDALIFLNLSPEHIESHGGYENYVQAKLKLAEQLNISNKPHKVLVTNAEDKESKRFVAATPNVEIKKEFSLSQAEPYMFDPYGLYISYKGKNVRSHLQGTFNIYNILAALTYITTQDVTIEQAQKGLNNLTGIAGRVQKIELPDHNPLSKKQNFNVIVDYAHTADSLEKVYGVFKESRKICVIGNTGGGRDTWKRPEMAKVANDNCAHIILTDEDPYDENPDQIIKEMLPGITSTPYEVIMDRRAAISRAISLAHKGDTVMITGKGTDPYIMKANGKKIPWSDAKVAEEELEKVLATK